MAAPVIEAADCTVSGNNTAEATWAVSHPAASTGDLLLFHIAWDDSTTTSSVSAPAGPNGETLTSVAGPVASNSTEVRAQVWRTVATGSWSASTVTFTPSATESWTATVIRVPAGEFASGAPIGWSNTRASADTTDTTVENPVGTIGAGDGGGTLVWFATADADPFSATEPTDWDILQRQDLGAVTHGVAVRTAATTGGETVAETTWGIAGDSWAGISYVVRGPYAVAIDAGALTIAGQSVDASIPAQGGDAAPLPHLGLLFADTGSDLAVTIDAGALTVAGQSATFGLGVATGGGALTIAGQSLTLSAGVALSAGALTVDGQTLTTDLTAGLAVTIDAGALTLAGQAFTASFNVGVTGGALTLEGQSLALNLAIATGGGALTLAGQTATAEINVAFGGGALTFAGQSAELTGLPAQGGDPAPLPHLGLVLGDSGNLGVSIDAGALTLTGQAISFAWSVPWDEGGLTLTGQSFTASVGVALAAGAMTLDGQTLTAVLGDNLAVDIDAGALTLDGQTLDAVLSDAAETPVEQPSGGWAAYNAYDFERRKRRLKALEDEDEADRLEALLIAEGQLPQNPVIDDRIVVREYALQVDVFNRRTQRAIDYALRARTDLAYQLAAREIANQLEDEEYAVLLLLAAA